MLRFIIKRILLVIPILIAVTFIVFFIMDLTPGDPATIILGDMATQEDIEQLNEEFGFNDPFLTRYFNYMSGVIRGDFGISWRTDRPVMGEVLARFPTTLTLASLGVLLAALIGIPIGIISAVKQYSIFDTGSVVSAMFLAAFPPFWLGLILILAFSLGLGWLPPSGLSTWKHYILPLFTIAIPQAAFILRFSRSTMLETIRQDYIRTARAKGAPERIVIFRHALKNALIPIITVLGVSFGHLLGGVVIIEAVFGISGMGQFALNAIRMKDLPQVMASVIFLSTVFCFIMLLVDIAYAFVDPRVKATFQSGKMLKRKPVNN
jgi:peptide/nickel transport system permease protein